MPRSARWTGGRRTAPLPCLPDTRRAGPSPTNRIRPIVTRGLRQEATAFAAATAPTPECASSTRDRGPGACSPSSTRTRRASATIIAGSCAARACPSERSAESRNRPFESPLPRIGPRGRSRGPIAPKNERNLRIMRHSVAAMRSRLFAVMSGGSGRLPDCLKIMVSPVRVRVPPLLDVAYISQILRKRRGPEDYSGPSYTNLYTNAV